MTVSAMRSTILMTIINRLWDAVMATRVLFTRGSVGKPNSPRQ
jgi:hypothetical protein